MISAIVDWVLAYGGYALGLVACVCGLLFARRARSKPPQLQRQLPPLSPDVSKRLAEAVRPSLIRDAEQNHERAKQALIEAHKAAQDAAREREDLRKASDEEILKRSQAFADRKRRELKERGLTVLVLGILLTTSSVRADDDIAQEQRNGVEGFWVSDMLWRETLADAESLPACQMSAERAESAALDAKSAAESYKAVAATHEIEGAERDRQLAEVMAQRDEARAQRDAWHRSHWFIGTAFMTGALASAFGAYWLTVRQ